MLKSCASYDKSLKVLEKMIRRPAETCSIYDDALQFKHLPEKYNVSSVIDVKGKFTTIGSCHLCNVFGVKAVLPGKISVPVSQDLLPAGANLQI